MLVLYICSSFSPTTMASQPQIVPDLFSLRSLTPLSDSDSSRPSSPTSVKLPGAHKSTPVKHKASVVERYAAHTTRVLAAVQYANLDRETSPHVLGPCPKDDFMKLLPKAKDTRPRSKKIGPIDANAACREDAFCSGINASKICKTFRFVNTKTKGDQYYELYRKPDAMVFRGSKRNLDVRAAAGRSLWGAGEIWVEDKLDDPFQDPDPTGKKKLPFLVNRDGARLVRGQLYSYALAQFTSQFRVFAFSILLLGDFIRMMYWDRAGVIVSERINWTTDETFAEILWRLDHLTFEQLGHDMTVAKPTSSESSKARAAFARSPDVDVSKDDPLQRFIVYDDDTGVERHIIVASARWYSKSLMGRATFGYVGVDMKTQKVVFLKDSWRIDQPDMLKEGEIYRRLHAGKVPHIPTLACAGDVPGQATRTREFLNTPWARSSGEDVLPQHHYRIVLETIGRPLSHFNTTWELCTGLRDAIEAHSKALEILGILHRDISLLNILLTRDGRGLLIDWDMCRDVNTRIVCIRRSWRSGTWQFMSVKLLMSPAGHEHSLADDLESFVHVLVYTVLRFRPTGVKNLVHDMNSVFDAHITIGAETTGGQGKKSFFAGSPIEGKVFRDYVPKPCADIIRELRYLFRDALHGDEDDTSAEERVAALKNLSSSAHVLEIFDSHLKRTTEWDANDGHEEQMRAAIEIISTGKRKRPFEFEFDLEDIAESSRKRQFLQSTSRGQS
ncbi:hypothetical protein OF83DRAFT_863265 [Amylostereum chailletii]|nr:hypothetical protein OF83DRAFT_863265 [Amylostereum chailletii]